MEAGEPNVVESSGSGSTGKFRRICVFCGSRSGNRPSFSQAALDLGKQLVRLEQKEMSYTCLLQELLFAY